MGFANLILAGKFIVPLLIIAIFSLFLTSLPLVGTMGFEFSVFIAFLASFLSVFVASELVSYDISRKNWRIKRFSDLVTSIYALNLLLVSVPFLIGLTSSVIKEDCYLREGIFFYLLIPLVSVFFSTSLVLLTGTLFPRRGFLLGSLVLVAVVCLSLWKLYSDAPFYSYNAVFGYFPGPLYDEPIPITLSFVLYRGVIFGWGVLLFIVLSIVRGIKYRVVNDYEILALVAVSALLLVAFLNRNELGIEHTRESIIGTHLSASVESPHFVIHYTPGTKTERELGLIVNDHEWRYHQLSEFLKTEPRVKIHSYIYPDTETRKRLVGAGETTVANPINREIHLVYDSFPHPLLKHELTHVLAAEFGARVLRVSPKPGLIEGLAVAADWSGNAYTPHEWSAVLIKNGAGVEVNDILGFGFWYLPQDISYTLMGSFCRYLIDNYGIEKFKEFYRTGDAGVYGVKVKDLVAEWREFLEGIPLPEGLALLAEYRFAGKSIFQGKCPRRISALKNKAINEYKDERYYAARGCLERALEHDPGNPLIIQMLSYTYYYERDYERLIGFVEGGDGGAGNVPEALRALLRNLKGNALWQLGEREAAIGIFLKLNRQALPSDVATMVELKIGAIRRGGELERGLREYFSTRDKVRQVAVLSDIVRRYPSYGPAYYLLGRIFYSRGDYERAAFYLEQSNRAGSRIRGVREHSSLLLGISYFASGDYPGAQRAFESVVDYEGGGGLARVAEDFIERAAWTAARRGEG